MTSMEKLAPFFEAYSEKVKRRRNEVGMTISALSEMSGVPYSNVSRVNSGVQANPLLYNEAAIADTLGLSLDALCGLAKPAGSPSELQERNHQLELENAKLVTTNEAQKAQIRSTHTMPGQTSSRWSSSPPKDKPACCHKPSHKPCSLPSRYPARHRESLPVLWHP